MKTTKYPLPWKLKQTNGQWGLCVMSSNDKYVAWGQRQENADLIIAAVNNHADLVGALQGMVDLVRLDEPSAKQCEDAERAAVAAIFKATEVK